MRFLLLSILLLIAPAVSAQPQSVFDAQVACMEAYEAIEDASFEYEAYKASTLHAYTIAMSYRNSIVNHPNYQGQPLDPGDTHITIGNFYFTESLDAFAESVPYATSGINNQIAGSDAMILEDWITAEYHFWEGADDFVVATGYIEMAKDLMQQAYDEFVYAAVWFSSVLDVLNGGGGGGGGGTGDPP